MWDTFLRRKTPVWAGLTNARWHKTGLCVTLIKYGECAAGVEMRVCSATWGRCWYAMRQQRPLVADQRQCDATNLNKLKFTAHNFYISPNFHTKKNSNVTDDARIMIFVFIICSDWTSINITVYMCNCDTEKSQKQTSLINHFTLKRFTDEYKTKMS